MKRNRVASAVAAALAVLLAATLAACSSAKGSSGSSKGKPKIVYIPQSLGNAYFQPISDALQKTATALGFDFQEAGPSDSGASSQIPFIESAIQNHVTAIAISANNVDAVSPALKRARQAGIIVVSVNSPVADGAADATVDPTDFSNIGPFMADMIGGLMNYSGKWAVLSATQGAPGQTKWIADIKTYTASNTSKFAKMNLIDTVYGNDDAALSATVMQGLLTKYSDLTAVLAPTAAGLPAAAKVLSQSPQKGKVILTGLAQPNAMKPYVQDGTVQKFALWDVPQEGIVTANLIAAIHNKTVTKTGDVYANVSITVNGATLTTDSTGTVNASHLITFDKSNIDQYNF